MSLNSKDRQINHYGELSGEIKYKPDGSNKIVSIPGHQFNYRLGYKDFYLIPIAKLPNNEFLIILNYCLILMQKMCLNNTAIYFLFLIFHVHLRQ